MDNLIGMFLNTDPPEPPDDDDDGPSIMGELEALKLVRYYMINGMYEEAMDTLNKIIEAEENE